ncbi:MAG: hypothetical protein E7586_01145 [Ruminococcaceae bacterium]|nr:hypothetical protein [Oscillospiraceae bacterium]
MKKILLILLAVVTLASSLVACTDSVPNESSAENTVAPSTSRPTSVATSSSKAPVVSSQPEEPESFKYTIETDDKFFNSTGYIQLMKEVFKTYKESLDDIETTADYYFESLSYDASTQSATVQVPCVKDGENKHLTLSYNYTYVGDVKTWVLTDLKYTDTLYRNTVGNDSEFVIKHYGKIQNVAFKFFRAYVLADNHNMLANINTLDNPCIENFNTVKGSFKDKNIFAIEYVEYDDRPTGADFVKLKIHTDKDGGEGTSYMNLEISISTVKTVNGNFEKKYTVSNFSWEE